MSRRAFIRRFCTAAFALCVLVPAGFAAEPKIDPRYPFRTDFANPHLPWYQLQPGEFPPHHSDRRIGGELVAADFIHRSGVFRRHGTGELMDFRLPPFGVVHYLNAPADLRDVPLGTAFLFFLHEDETGALTQAATLQDDYTMTANHHASYRLDAVKLSEGKLVVTRQKLPARAPDGPSREWLVTAETRVWQDGEQVKLDALAEGDELLANFTGSTATHPRRCTDLWIGSETHLRTTDRQRAKHAAFAKTRGLPAWIHSVEAKQITVDLLASEEPADRQQLGALIAAEFTVGKAVQLAVANDELRTYWPPVDGKRARLVKVEKTPTGAYGTGGWRFTLEPALMLEGFRKGRVVRLFAEKWPVEEMPLGEGLQAELSSAETNEIAAKEYPAEFAYRTDFGNARRPWYRLKAGEIPPRYSEHRVWGELVKVDAAKRTGQFRTDRTGALVDFSLTPEGALVYINKDKPDNVGPVRWDSMPASVMYLNSPATLGDLPLGMRCCFHLYQEEGGAFTRASLVTDEFTVLAVNKVSWRIEALNPETGRLQVARQLPQRKNLRRAGYDQPPDIGRAELLVDANTRVWTARGQGKLSDLAIGDALLINQTAGLPSQAARCTDLWVGGEAHRLASEQQAGKSAPVAK